MDELASERAVERTLTSEGALLSAGGQFEIEPFVACDLEVRRNACDRGVQVRRGLPFESPLALDLPHRHGDGSINVLGQRLLGGAKTLLRARSTQKKGRADAP